MNKNLKEKLIYSGLSPKQADIYIYLNSNGESTANNIAKSLGFDRTVVYNTLNRLIDMGFVSHSNKGNIKVFFASNPETITQKMKEKETILLEAVDELKTNIDEPAKNYSKDKRNNLVICNGRCKQPNSHKRCPQK